ncbi:hypothetical protein J3R30DRAFT_2716375 [Lentinula aciculospora]|uniref:Uncharacterized protein n=1 Tax=Lentinula aciculospora TaxID=153920 RepID=A0A9W9ACU4_9AGAR|nr:hypothetical protein J3R30DRAFT_2716375 [Lentinula aciculospora]
MFPICNSVTNHQQIIIVRNFSLKSKNQAIRCPSFPTQTSVQRPTQALGIIQAEWQLQMSLDSRINVTQAVPANERTPFEALQQFSARAGEKSTGPMKTVALLALQMQIGMNSISISSFYVYILIALRDFPSPVHSFALSQVSHLHQVHCSHRHLIQNLGWSSLDSNHETSSIFFFCRLLTNQIVCVSRVLRAVQEEYLADILER